MHHVSAKNYDDMQFYCSPPTIGLDVYPCYHYITSGCYNSVSKNNWFYKIFTHNISTKYI